jgi:hypothetical protein
VRVLTCLELPLLFLELLPELDIDLPGMRVLRPLVVKASSQGSQFLAVASKGLEFLGLFPGVSDHTLRKKGNLGKQLDIVTGEKVFRS